MTAAINTYQARMRRAVDYIDATLDGDLDLDAVSAVAAFSKFHFHRQFSATFGVSLHDYVQLARLKRAGLRLAHAPADRITDIALDAGYGAPDAFARAFRRRLGQSPSAFRKAPDWTAWQAAFDPFDDARSKLMTTFTPADVTIREVAETPVAIFEHRGDPASLPATIARFIAWRKANGLSPMTSRTFNIWRSERRPADPADYSMDLCAATDAPVTGEGVRAGTIPAGRVAVLRVEGDTHNLEPAALYLYRDWLPASGEEMRDFPVYCERLWLDGPGGATAAEIHLPLKQGDGVVRQTPGDML